MYNSTADLTPEMIAVFRACAPTFRKTDDCVLWDGRLDPKGYGVISAKSRGTNHITGAHRVSYILSVGPIPDGLVLDHLCRVRNCINPAHLEPVTSAENTRRGFPGRKPSANAACPQGHPWVDGEYYLATGPGRSGTKVCRKCRAEAKKRYRARGGVR